MVLVRDHIEEIVRDCFSEDNKAVLEFTQNNTTITIKDQFLYHYESACYTGTLEGLKKAIMYKIYQHQDLLLKMADYKENIRRILDLGEYSKVSLGYKDQLGSETSIGMSGSESEGANLQADQYSGVDQAENINIDDNRTALSQTNIVDGLKVVIPQPSIKQGEAQNLDSFNLGETVIFKGQIPYNKPTLNNPQMEDGEKPLGYQNLTKDITTNQRTNTNTTSTSRGTESKHRNTSKHANTQTKGTKLDEVNKTVEFITNDARLKLWKTELPKLQLKFWNVFYNLFIYEQY